MENFTVEGPLGEIECVVEPNRSESDAVLVISHGFRGSLESSGFAKSYAVKAAGCCDVVRYNFTGTTKLSVQLSELAAVVAQVRELKPKCQLFLMGRSMGSAVSMLYAAGHKDVAGLILWSAPNDLQEALNLVLGRDAYAKLTRGESLHLVDERGECDITPDFVSDYHELGLLYKYEHWDGRPVLLFHCEGDEFVPVQQARKNVELLGQCCESHIFAGGSHSIGEYNEEAGDMLREWLLTEVGVGGKI